MEKLRKRKYLVAVALVLAGIMLFCSGMTVGAATNEPGSAGDPLITRSYLEKELKGIGSGYECITLGRGETLSLKQGAQVIIYTGNALIVESMLDITSGTLVSGGKKAERYHAYLAPADKSGFTAETTCVIFLAGNKYQ